VIEILLAGVNDPNRDFNEVIRTIRKEDERYARGAYYFLRQALDFSLKEMHKQGELDKNNHLSGQQLLEGIRLYAIDQYGPMARAVLEHWGIKKCRDFGNIVFNLVECRVLGKTDQDSPEDFNKGYNFKDAFDVPFHPEMKPTIKRPPLR
jgi:uncharacterized repeat protein (TIGR04138 family)